MQGFLTGHHSHHLEQAKQSAAHWALQTISLSDHSDLSAQETLCLESVLTSVQGDGLRDQLDWIDGDNAVLQRELVPLRRPEPEPEVEPEREPEPGSEPEPEPAISATASDASDGSCLPLRLHLESIIDLLATSRPSDGQRALLDQLRDETLAQLWPDEDEERAATADRARQTLRPFERFAARRHWWRVHQPEPKPLINESPSVSSAHISDEWELSKADWLDHLRRRSALTVTPVDSAEAVGSRPDSDAALVEVASDSAATTTV
ncbi:uncharacterized protein LOC119099989 [Pollicipes pollicipes]|nr:uncharacterized protein LOC119099989 [Pollicipes pollicipes]